MWIERTAASCCSAAWARCLYKGTAIPGCGSVPMWTEVWPSWLDAHVRHWAGKPYVGFVWATESWAKGTLNRTSRCRDLRGIPENSRVCMCFKFFRSDLCWILFRRRRQGQHGEEDLNGSSSFNLWLWLSFKNVKNWSLASRRELKLRTVESQM